MFDNKFLITLIGLIVAVVAINNIKSKDEETIENFWGNYPYGVTLDSVAAENPKQAKKGKFVSLASNSYLRNQKNTKQLINDSTEFYGQNNALANKGDFFTVPGTFQSSLPARMSNVDYGANIRYNMPSREHQAVPVNPLTFGGMAKRENFRNRNVKENFCSSCNEDDESGVPSCARGGYEKEYHGGAPLNSPDYALNNYQDVTNNAYSGGNEYSEGNLPVSDMTSIGMDGEDGKLAPVVYNRLMFSSSKSRLKAQGDPIRGDLGIVPCTGNWFTPAARPTEMLQQGAMNVMGGQTNETSRKLDKLLYKSYGYAENEFGGMVDTDLNNVNMGNDFGGGLSQYNSTNQIRTFP